MERREKLRREVRLADCSAGSPLDAELRASLLLNRTQNGTPRRRRGSRNTSYVATRSCGHVAESVLAGQKTVEGRASADTREARVSPFVPKHCSIFEVPSQSQAEIPSTLTLQSSSTLGTGRASTHQERQDRQEDKEVKRALNGRAGKRKRPDDSYAVTMAGDDDDSADEVEPKIGRRSSPDGAKVSAASFVPESGSIAVEPSGPSTSAVGSALQRNSDGTVVAPRIRSKSRAKVRSCDHCIPFTVIYPVHSYL